MKYKFNINNLDCANCAREIEEGLSKVDYLSNVIVNFNTSKISFYSEEKIDLNELNKLVQSIEPDATVTKEDVKNTKEFHVEVLLIACVFGLVSLFVDNSIIKNILLIVAYVLLLYRTFTNAIKLLIKSKTINENALITISCVGAYLVGEPFEGLMVVVLYTIGKLLEQKALYNSRKSISDIINIKQNYANLKIGKEIKQIDVDFIKLNSILVVKKGEKVPTDGFIINGETKLDMSMLTGESDLVEVHKGDKILSGSINTGDVIEMKVTTLFEDSTVSKILELVEEATDKKTKTETFIAKASRVYTPVVLLLAILVAIILPLVTNLSYSQSIYRGLTFLVISCPCAIAISVPLAYFTGIGVSSFNGILVKGSNFLDNLSHANKIIFDKTGTLTNGSFSVTDIDVIDDNYTKDEIIDIITKGESLSNHPIAKSITKLRDNIDNSDVKSFKEIDGAGITFKLNDDLIYIGNKEICDCGMDAVLHVNINKKHVASITIDDGIKDNAVDTISFFKQNNIKTFMFTGDKKSIATNIGKKLGIDVIKYEMLPTDKYSSYESILEDGDIAIFVGDGVNDAPVLKRADIGISMGAIGSEIAIDSSDIVLMSDELNKIPLGIEISKYTNFIIKQNLIFAIGVKVLILLLSVFGIANMWFAVFADTGVTLITILNTLRIIKKYKKD